MAMQFKYKKKTCPMELWQLLFPVTFGNVKLIYQLCLSDPKFPWETKNERRSDNITGDEPPSVNCTVQI